MIEEEEDFDEFYRLSTIFNNFSNKLLKILLYLYLMLGKEQSIYLT